MTVLGGGEVSDERGTPVVQSAARLARKKAKSASLSGETHFSLVQHEGKITTQFILTSNIEALM